MYMVQAMINISKKTNQILNIVKAKYNFKDKSQAIEQVVLKYGSEILEPELKPEFIEKMKKLEKEHNISLLFDFKKDFNIQETKSLPKPFRKGNIIKAKLAFPGRLRGEKVAIAEGRAISVYNCDAELNATVKLKIIREKHNIFAATPI